MKSIPLTKGLFATVDDEDYEKAMQYRWQATLKKGVHYAQCKPWDKVKKKYFHVSLHRHLLDAPAGVKVDHKDRNTHNNCRTNLRLATKAQNNMNACKPSHGLSTPYKGVAFFKRDGNFRAYIKKDGRQIHLGYYATPEAAASAYDVSARQLFGEFARPNFA